MKTVTTALLLAGLFLLAPAILSAQRVGLSVGSVGSPSLGSVSAGASMSNAPQMPPLPRPLPIPPAISLPSLPVSLKPLNLLSNHLAPAAVVSPPASKPGVLPALPFALDPIAARGFQQMCVAAPAQKSSGPINTLLNTFP